MLPRKPQRKSSRLHPRSPQPRPRSQGYKISTSSLPSISRGDNSEMPSENHREVTLPGGCAQVCFACGAGLGNSGGTSVFLDLEEGRFSLPFQYLLGAHPMQAPC
jgi:hypothetical protein